MQFLGPQKGLAALDTWEHVVAAAEGGLLEETQWCELKQVIPTGSGRNRELARDLASLSVHGGVLIVGIKDKTNEVVGCDTAGLRDRIAAVASTIVHPPLSPVILPDVTNPDDESKAVLIVEVPPSPLAPHMVDDKYWGRSPVGKQPLTDAHVRELIVSRNRTAAAFEERISAFVASDPISKLVSGPLDGSAAIYLMAEPCAPILGRAEEFNLRSAMTSSLGGSSVLGRLHYPWPDPVGQALAGEPEPVPPERVHWAGRLLVHDDDSAIEAVAGGVTAGIDGSRHINVADVAAAVLNFYDIVRKLALEHWGYAGLWRVGVHIGPLTSAVVSARFPGRPPLPFNRDSYDHVEVVSPTQWGGEIEPPARRLLQRFLRAVDHNGWTLYEVSQGRRDSRP